MSTSNESHNYIMIVQLLQIISSWDRWTYTGKIICNLSITLKHDMLEINPNLPVAIKKYWESSWMPIVPGPTMSANTFTIEKAPLIIPNPSPETVKTCRKLLTKFVT
jgi:hypothetical protein